MLAKLSSVLSEVRVRICSVAAQYVGSQQVGAETPQLEFSSAAHRSGEEKAKDKEKFGHIYSYNDVVRLRVARALSYTAALAVGLQLSNWWDRKCARAAPGLGRNSVIDTNFSRSAITHSISIEAPSDSSEVSSESSSSLRRANEIATQTESPDFAYNFVAVMHNVIGLDMVRNKLYPEAAVHFKKASKLGYAPAQYNLGQCYLKGYGTEKSLDEAKHWWQLASDQSHKKAQRQLEVYYAHQSANDTSVVSLV